MMFDRVIAAVDGSPESVEAARQAARLVPPQSEFTLLEVVNPGEVAPAGVTVTGSIAELEDSAGRTLRRIRTDVAPVHPAEVCLLEGAPIPTLLDHIEREQGTLVAVGIHGHSRAAGIALGSVATAMLHEAPASVLVARTPRDPQRFPSSLTIGFDGSPGARTALNVGRELAERFGASLRAVCAQGGRAVDIEAIRREIAELPATGLVEDGRRPVEALVSTGADLLVLGSRSLHGMRSLGSVSERVAHQADCSVLVVH